MNMNMNSQPLVSVIMGVYNTPIDYLEPAIKSILFQSYINFEFIIIDDHSDDWCSQWLNKVSTIDDRIKLYRNDINKGVTKTLNIALSLCNGEYVARMDADDVSLPNRLNEQVIYLEKNLDVNVLACIANNYEESILCYMDNEYHINPAKITEHFSGIYRCFEHERNRVRLSLQNIVFTHPTVMFRRQYLVDNDIKYDENISKAQDYAMWCRCEEDRCLGVLQKVLFIYRDNQFTVSNTLNDKQKECSNYTKTNALKKFWNNPTEREIYLYSKFRDMKMEGSVDEHVELISKLIHFNEEKRVYDDTIYRQEIFFWILRKCLYRCNRGQGLKLLFKPYVFINVVKVFPHMLYEYILDLGYNKKMTKKLKYELVDWFRILKD